MSPFPKNGSNSARFFGPTGTILSPRGDWLVAGGMSSNDSYYSSAEILDILTPGESGEDVAGHWHRGPKLQSRTWKPCLVQVILQHSY